MCFLQKTKHFCSRNWHRPLSFALTLWVAYAIFRYGMAGLPCLICWQSSRHFPLTAFVQGWTRVHDSAPKFNLAVGFDPQLQPTVLLKRPVSLWTACLSQCLRIQLTAVPSHSCPGEKESTQQTKVFCLQFRKLSESPWSLFRDWHGKSEIEPKEMQTSHLNCSEFSPGKKALYVFVESSFRTMQLSKNMQHSVMDFSF